MVTLVATAISWETLRERYGIYQFERASGERKVSVGKHIKTLGPEAIRAVHSWALDQLTRSLDPDALALLKDYSPVTYDAPGYHLVPDWSRVVRICPEILDHLRFPDYERAVQALIINWDACGNDAYVRDLVYEFRVKQAYRKAHPIRL